MLRGRKHSIENWPSAHAQVVPALTQQISFMREALPHSPPHPDNLISTGSAQAEEDSDSDKEDLFFLLFASERRRRLCRAAALGVHATFLDRIDHLLPPHGPQASTTGTGKDEVVALTLALERRASLMEVRYSKLEELHRDINSAAIHAVLAFNDSG